MIRHIGLAEFIDKNFLIIPKPYDNELLSSWFVRTAYMHYMKPQSFFNMHFGLKNRGYFISDIDTKLSNEIYSKMQDKCKNKIDINKLTLKYYAKNILEEGIKDSTNHFISNMKFCPKCIKLTNKKFYFRKEWKLVFYTACLKHKCYLYDSCPHCLSKILITKMYKDKLPFTYCYKCGFDLKQSKVIPIKKRHLYGLEAIKKLLFMLENGYIQLKNTTAYSFHFFIVLTQLTKLIMNKRNFVFLHTHPLFEIIELIRNKELITNKSIYLQLAINEKYALFGLLMNIFENYPNNLSKFILSNKLTHWDMVREIKYLPFWYNEIVNDIIPRYMAFGDMVTEIEIENAKKYLLSQNLEITKANLSRLFGRTNYFNKYIL